MKSLLNTPDEYGSIALHYACREGLLSTIDTMFRMGVVMNTKNKDKKSPLHFAAK